MGERHRRARAVLLAAVRRHWRVYACAVGAAAMVAAVTLAVPVVARRTITDVAARGNDDRAVVYLAILAGLAFVRGLGAGVRRYNAAMLPVRVTADLRVAVHDAVHRLPVADVRRLGVGELVARSSTDLAVVEQALGPLVATTQGALLFVGGVATLLWVEWRLALVELLAVGAVLAWAALGSRRMQRPAVDAAACRGRYERFAEEEVAGNRVVRGHGLEDVRVARAGELIGRLEEAARALGHRQAVVQGGIQGSQSVVLATVLAVAVPLVAPGAAGAAELFVFLQYTFLMFMAVQSLANLVAGWPSGMAAMGRLLDVLDTAPDAAPDTAPDTAVAALPASDLAGTVEGVVRFQNVVFAYEPGRPVLHGLDFAARPGELVAVLGGSGAGKTTVARLLAGFVRPVSGAVEVDGVPVERWAEPALHRAVTVVEDDAFLFTSTVGENIRVADPDASDEAIEAAARRAAVHEVVAELPDGYDTVVGMRGRELSGGQRQRVGLARALLRASPVLVCDAVTTALDPATASRVLDGLREAARTRTVLLLTDDPAVADRCDRVVALSGARAGADVYEAAP